VHNKDNGYVGMHASPCFKAFEYDLNENLENRIVQQQYVKHIQGIGSSFSETVTKHVPSWDINP
jgi:hypothetical protein